MASYVEHVNLSVTAVDEAIRFFRTAMPDLQIRHDSGKGPRRWVHLGTEVTYLAINQMPDPAQGTYQQRHPGFNHVGFVVDDVDALRERMLRAGYREGYVPDPHPHRKRVYIIDADGMEHEFVQYYADDFAKRNDYAV